jgi:hypothetical protein
MVVPPLGLLYSQEIFRQNSLHHGESEAVGGIGTAIEAAWCFSLLLICDNVNNVLGESINLFRYQQQNRSRIHKNETKSKKQNLIHIDNG